MTLYSASDIARQYGIPARRVRFHCQRLLLPKVGATYVIDEVGRESLLSALALARPGPRPRCTDGT